MAAMAPAAASRRSDQPVPMRATSRLPPRLPAWAAHARARA